MANRNRTDANRNKTDANRNKTDANGKTAKTHESASDHARAAALDILIKIMEEDAFSHLALREGLSAHPALSERDRAFVTRLAEGSTERAIQLDWAVNRCSSTKTAKMKPFIRNLLRMSAYQILFLDRVPDAAAINEAVKFARRRGFAGLSGFVNGVLRSISRDKEALLALLSDTSKTPAHIVYGMPEWLYLYLSRLYGKEETARICKWFLSDANEIYVRYQDGSSGTLTGNVAASEAFLNGELTVQDYASQQVGLKAAPQAGSYVVDVCAAPGGKSCHIAALLNGTGTVDARDVSAEKVRMIEENAARLKLHNIRTKVWDARVPDPALMRTPAKQAGQTDAETEGIADIVIADLPCSGLGIIGKKPDIRLHASMEQIKSLQALQREILSVVSRYVKPGGRLIYSTCTITKEENQDNARFISETLGLRLLNETQYLPGEPSDGFYIAEFARKKG